MVVLGRGITGLPLSDGSILVGVGGIVDELTIGTPGQVLTVVDNPVVGETDFVQWADAAGGSGNGDVTNGENLISSGASIFSAKSGSILQFRKISAGSSNVTITEGLNEVSISVAASPVTSVNSQTGAVTLGLMDLSNVTGTPSNGQALVWNGANWAPADISSGGEGEANTGTNLGSGIGIYAGKSGQSLQFNSLKAGDGITISQTDNEITIENASPGTTGGLTSVGISSPNSTIAVSNSPLLANGTISVDLPTISGIAGTYTRLSDVTIDDYGRITEATSIAAPNINKFLSISGNTGSVTAVSDTSALTISGTEVVSSISGTTMTLSLGNVSGLTPGSYTNASITVDAKGRITSASNGTHPNSYGSVATDDGTAVSGNSGAALTLNGINGIQTSTDSGAVRVGLTTSGVTAGSYGAATGTAAQITVDAYGRITSATNKQVMQSLSTDLNPALGGNLNIGAYEITTNALNGNIVLKPNGTGNVNVSNTKITNVATPTQSSDAATKGYVDSLMSGGSGSLGGLTDVTITTPLANQIVSYNISSARWENTDQITTIAALNDVDLTNIGIGKYLQYNGTKWEAADITVSSISLNSLADVNADSPSNGDMIAWSDDDGSWKSISPGYLSSFTAETDSGTASSTYDTIKIFGGLGIETSGDIDEITISNTFTTIASLTDVDIANPLVQNDILVWTGNEWAPTALPDYATVAFSEIVADDANTIEADSSSSSVTFAGLNGVSTSINGSTLSISVSQSLSDLNNVNVSAVADGNVLYYSSTTDKWVAGTIPVSLNALTDVNVSANANGNILVYNTVDAKWVSVVPSTISPNMFTVISGDSGDNITPSTSTAEFSILGKSLSGIYTETDADNNVVYIDHDIGLGGLSDVVITGTPDVGNVIQFNGVNWVNTELTLSVGMGDLNDALISNPLAGDVIHFDGTDWVNSAMGITISSQSGALSINSINKIVSITGSSGITTSVSNDTMTVSWSASIGDLVDVDTNSVSLNGGEVLAFNELNGSWEPRATGEFSLVSDPTPTLGSDLSVNGYGIVSSTGTDIKIRPGGDDGRVDIGHVIHTRKQKLVVDDQGTAAIISAFSIGYEYTAIDYHYKSTTGRRIGTLLVLNDGTDTSITDTGTELGAPVVDFTAVINDDDVDAMLVEVVIEGEPDSEITYSIRQMSV